MKTSVDAKRVRISPNMLCELPADKPFPRWTCTIITSLVIAFIGAG